MLELYHHGSSVCAAKVRFALNEKGLEWKGHYIDILKGDQFTPEYRKLNEKAVVPTLVHDRESLLGFVEGLESLPDREALLDDLDGLVTNAFVRARRL